MSIKTLYSRIDSRVYAYRETTKGKALALQMNTDKILRTIFDIIISPDSGDSRTGRGFGGEATEGGLREAAPPEERKTAAVKFRIVVRLEYRGHWQHCATTSLHAICKRVVGGDLHCRLPALRSPPLHPEGRL